MISPSTRHSRKRSKFLGSLFLTASFLGLLSFTACQSAQQSAPQSEPPQVVDFSKYHTFAVTPLATEGPRTDPTAPARLAKPVQDAVVQAMMAKGYRQVPVEQADLLIRVRGEFMPDALTEGSEHRTLVLEAVDNHTSKIIWTDSRGKSGSVGSMPPETLQKTIADILAPFPSAAR